MLQSMDAPVHIPQVVDHLAELTAYRDRDILDVTLAGALRDLLHPLCVAIHRTVGQAAEQRWLTRARLARGDAVASADPLSLDLDALPALEAFPLRHACLRNQQPHAQAADGSVLTVFPLSTDRDVVGVLEVEIAAPLTAEHHRMVASVLRIYSNFQGLLDYSERDTLTGLLNRKTFDESFLRVAGMLPPTLASESPVPAARRLQAGAGVWLGVIDIDHFKRVNDTHGHLIGDEVLLLLSRLMRSSFRFHDHLYRFGGEEFVVLMRCADAADAASAFERLRSNVQAYAFPRVGTITVSVGFTQVRPGDTPSVAFERADKAVYHSKQNGRNQVADHADLVARGVLADATRDSDLELF
jgi:diguanylate cyclase (GGDEF)-like protein